MGDSTEARNLERANVGEDTKDTFGWRGTSGLWTTCRGMEPWPLNCEDGGRFRQWGNLLVSSSSIPTPKLSACYMLHIQRQQAQLNRDRGTLHCWTDTDTLWGSSATIISAVVLSFSLLFSVFCLFFVLFCYFPPPPFYYFPLYF